MKYELNAKNQKVDLKLTHLPSLLFAKRYTVCITNLLPELYCTWSYRSILPGLGGTIGGGVPGGGRSNWVKASKGVVSGVLGGRGGIGGAVCSNGVAKLSTRGMGGGIFDPLAGGVGESVSEDGDFRHFTGRGGRTGGVGDSS